MKIHKGCFNCKYLSRKITEEPCSRCGEYPIEDITDPYDQWEAADSYDKCEAADMKGGGEK